MVARFIPYKSNARPTKIDETTSSEVLQLTKITLDVHYVIVFMHKFIFRERINCNTEMKLVSLINIIFCKHLVAFGAFANITDDISNREMFLIIYILFHFVILVLLFVVIAFLFSLHQFC